MRALLLIITVAVSLLGALGCSDPNKVDPAYQTLIEIQSQGEIPTSGELGPEDKFSLRVFQEEGFSGDFIISPLGAINYPYIGRLSVIGKTCSDLETEIATMLRDGGYLANPVVSCTITEYNSKRVYILGAVAQPGVYPYRSHSTTVEAIAQAGGFSPRAMRNRVLLTRKLDGNILRVEVPVQDIIEGLRQDIKLLPGDIVEVPNSPF
ncbi:MAG: polysaccharide biosynthesis/export family protein [Myxococcota bacterium]